MFPTLTLTNSTNARRRTALKMIGALVGLTLAASACGGSGNDSGADAAVQAVPGLTAADIEATELAAEANTVAPAPAVEASAPNQTDNASAADTSSEAPSTPVEPADTPVGPLIIDEPDTTPEPDPDELFPDKGGDGPHEQRPLEPGDGGSDGIDVPTDGNTGPMAPANFGTVRVSSPEMEVAQACFAETGSITWTASTGTGMILEDLIDGVAEAGTVRTPLTFDHNERGGPLLTHGIEAKIDEFRGFALTYGVNGQVGDIDISWAALTSEPGGHTSPAFSSPSNPACFVRVGFGITIDSEPPTTRPGDVLVGQAPTNDEAALDRPSADFEVAVRPVKIDLAPKCFDGPLPTRLFHTGTTPVTVVLDTKGISAKQTTTQEHVATELTDQLSELAISDGALRAFASDDLGYRVTVDMEGFVTGGIGIDWALIITEPGHYTSPVFSSLNGGCDAQINFDVIEIRN